MPTPNKTAVLALAVLTALAGCSSSGERSTVGTTAIPAFSATSSRVLFNDNWKFAKVSDAEFRAADMLYFGIRPHLLPTANAFRSAPATRPTTRPFGVENLAEIAPSFDDSKWRSLNLPHDWAIEGPFKQEYEGSTGKLPFWGVAWYRKTFNLPSESAGKKVFLDVDGAMSYSAVFINGELAGGWPYGYASYRVDLTPFVKPGQSNTIAIRLENPSQSSRWYPGSGIYRNVYLTTQSQIHVPQWGTKISTSDITAASAKVNVEAQVQNESGAASDALVWTELFLANSDGAPTGSPVAITTPTTVALQPNETGKVAQAITVPSPKLWDITSPHLYVAKTYVSASGSVTDAYTTQFGIRTAEFTANDGFHLNGRKVPIYGVCNHHDLGALGSAVNIRALQRQLEILRECGVNAIRTSHNPPAPELVELCDRMGFVMMVETFDCWQRGKRRMDYNLLWKDWHEADTRSMVRHFRNSPSVVLWSIGNEIPDAPSNAGPALAQALVNAVKLEDTSRPTVLGSNNARASSNGVEKVIDIYGVNYRTVSYDDFKTRNPNQPFISSESASTVSTRGEYFFGTGQRANQSDFQVSSYDLDFPRWATTPDVQFKLLDEHPWVAGEFVWTGFDYLGEPTPYDRDVTNLLNYSDPVARERAAKELEALGKILVPSRSSYFGIVDIAGFKKDRFYMYQAHWRPEVPMAHVLPHWTWPGREGQPTPVHVYTSGDEAELFLNGKSLGRKKKAPLEYRIVWDAVSYEPGTLKVVSYKNGKEWAADQVQTAGNAASIKAEADRATITADGQDLSFITLTVNDAKGIEVPRAKNRIKLSATGPAEIVALDNGDPTSHVPFHSTEMQAFNGKLLVIVKMKGKGAATVTATAEGLPPASVIITGK